MSGTIPANFGDLWSSDHELQSQAFCDILDVTGSRVDWAYDVWAQLLQNLKDKDNHNRSIAAQMLCNLAKSDPENRLLRDFGALFAVTRDERFVTSRHCLQALWKVGVVGTKQQDLLVDALEGRFAECAAEKNCTLIRYDIIQVLRRLYDAVKDEKVKATALELIETEQDMKYRKKYASLWKSR